jgi:hypothetical protein|tara:strand:+ start:1276 stop:1980 length:705 start_codon:yes stop_codon:yes gene_type:complete
MAVARREKNTDPKYKAAIGTRPPLIDSAGRIGREPDALDVIEDLRDDMNSMCNLSALNENKTGITSSQASAITANTAKNGISSSQAAAITANTAKKGLSPCFIRLDSPASGIVSRESGLGIGSTNPFIPSLNHAVTIDSRDGIKFSNLSVGIYKVQVNVIADASRHNPVTITGRIGRNAVIQRQFINVGSFCDFSFVDLVNITDAREELFFTLTSASSTTVTVLPGTTIYLEKI